MLRYCSLVAFVLSVGFSVQNAYACPQSYVSIDNALWKEARDSLDPARWVQYYVTAGCPENKVAARALLVPLLGDPDKPNSSALDQILLTGKFSGDQTQTFYKAKNGNTLKPSGEGLELYTFQMFSVTKVTAEIPRGLFQGLNPPEPSTTPRNVAFWIRYRCKILNTHTFTPWFGDPTASGTPPGDCAPGGSHVIEGIEAQLMGPYARFFDAPAISSQPAGTGGANNLTLSVKLKPQYSSSFMGMLTGNFVR